MPGHLQKKGNHWYVVLDRGYCPETGKRRTPKWVSVKKELGLNRPAKKGEATKLLNVLLAQEIQGQEYVVDNGLTLAQVIETWLPAHKVARNLVFNSYDQYKNISEHIKEDIGHHPIVRITSAQLQNYLTELSQRTSSPHTLHAYGKTLNLVFKSAKSYKYIQENPMEHVVKPKLPNNDIEYWTEEELKTFLEFARSSKYYALFLLASTTGMRKSEIINLRQRHVNWKENTVTVEDAKTKSGWRTIDISPHVMEELKPWQGHEYLFFTNRGNKLTKNSPNHAMQVVIRKSGVRYITFHGFRHTYATIMLSRGTNPVELAETLGHKNPSLLWETYAHLLPLKRKENATRMDDLFLE